MLSLLVYSGLSGPAHPPKEKYSLKAVIVACLYGVSFQDQHTLPKRNILSKLLLWLALCICISGPAHPPKVKYSLKFLLWLVLSARIQWLFRTSTPSQREIFSLTAVIVACSHCLYTVAFQDQHTLPKRNILSKLLLWLARMEFPFRTSTPSQREIVYSLKAVIVACSVYLHFRTSTPSQSEIFSQVFIVACSLCSYTVAFQDQHTLPKRNILSHSCYCGLLSLLVYSGLSGPAHPPKEKYSLKAVIVACSVYLCFRTSTPSQREIFSQSCYCGLLCVFAFQDQHTLPKRNILSKLLLWLALCICISGPAHPPKVKYSLKAFIVACSLCVFAFQDQHTLPKRNILSKLLLCLLCVFAFQDQHTLPKRNILSQLLLWLARMEFPFRTSTPSQRKIFSQSCYCGLLVWSFLSGPAHPPKEKYSLKAVIVACSARIQLLFRTSTPSQRKICSLTAVIVACSLCSYTVSFQDQHTLPK